MSTSETNVLGLPGLKEVDAELLDKWRLGFESEGAPEEEETGTEGPGDPEGEEGLDGDPVFEEPVAEPDPATEAAEAEATLPEEPVEPPVEDPAAY